VVVYALVPGVVLLALAVAGVSLRLVAAKPSPFWGRLGDIADIVLMIAMLPLALAVLDVYETIRGLVG
jgi:hypothetical protein